MMTETQRAAMQQALEALAHAVSRLDHQAAIQDCDEAITAIKAALAEPVQEPDDGVCDGSRGGLCIHQDPNQCKPERDCPAFSAPSQRKTASTLKRKIK